MKVKKLVVQCLAALIILSLPSISFGTGTFVATGSAVVPGVITRYVESGRYTNCNIYISNTTDSEIICKVTFYDHNGNDVTSTYGKVYSAGGASSSAVEVYSSDGEFTLPALSTRMFRASSTSVHSVQGFAVIEWHSSNSTLRKALAAYAKVVDYAGSYQKDAGAFAVDGGQIF